MSLVNVARPWHTMSRTRALPQGHAIHTVSQIKFPFRRNTEVVRYMQPHHIRPHVRPTVNLRTPSHLPRLHHLCMGPILLTLLAPRIRTKCFAQFLQETRWSLFLSVQELADLPGSLVPYHQLLTTIQQRLSHRLRHTMTTSMTPKTGHLFTRRLPFLQTHKLRACAQDMRFTFRELMRKQNAAARTVSIVR